MKKGKKLPEAKETPAPNEVKDLSQTKIFKDWIAETKAEEGDGGKKRILVAKISTPNTDRSKDHVFPEGAVIENFLKNPVVQFAHNYDELPIAKCTGLKISETGILATVQFPDEGVYPKADIIYTMYKEGFLNAWSIGFMPLEYDDNKDGGYDFKKWELFEFSSVPVPDNPEALTVMRSKGINLDALQEKKEATDEELKALFPETTEVKAGDKPEEPAKPTEPQAPTKAEGDDDESAYTDETKLPDLTVADLKTILLGCMDGEGGDEMKQAGGKAIQKDVREVVVLAYVLDELNYFISYFENNEVSQSSIDKLKQALALVLEVVKEQAELGKKELPVDFAVNQITKVGRTISSKHEDCLKAACDHMDKAAEQVKTVLASVAEEDDTDDEGDTNDGDKQITPSLYKRLSTTLKNTDKEVGLTLRLLKSMKK